MEHVTFQVVARVRNGRTSTGDRDWGDLESAIVMEPGLEAALTGLDDFSHLIVVFYMHLDPNQEPFALIRRPRGRPDMPLRGVFAQRGRMRPNTIGITTVPIVRVEPHSVVVRGLDAVDDTPVLDLKPYVPIFDHPESPRVPEWMERLMQGYF
jgi:tRNA-Thr(GGU) m(6)t(6)A37 methyltransferase TsaA